MPGPSAIKRRILVTGAAGRIGRPVVRELSRYAHTLRGFDRRQAPEPADFHVGELTDPETIRTAMQGMDTVIHLAATPADADFMEHLLPNNIVGLFHIFDAAREAGIARLVVTSSVQVVDGLTASHRPVRLSDGVAPRNHYAVTKVFAEQMAEMYAHRFGMSIIVVRPGWVPRDKTECQGRPSDIYLSHRDAGRFFRLCAESADPPGGGRATLFATSRPSGNAVYELEPAKKLLGYQPEDGWAEGLE